MTSCTFGCTFSAMLSNPSRRSIMRWLSVEPMYLPSRSNGKLTRSLVPRSRAGRGGAQPVGGCGAQRQDRPVDLHVALRGSAPGEVSGVGASPLSQTGARERISQQDRERGGEPGGVPPLHEPQQLTIRE